jgi:hypothetical protein
LEQTQPQPSAIIDSGNGLQVLWRLDRPIILGEPVDGEYSAEDRARIDDVEARIGALIVRLGGTAGTQNIDRIRLPGTINLPNKTKLKAGRVPCPATLMAFDDSTHPLEAFPKPPPSSNPTSNRPEATNAASVDPRLLVNSLDEATKKLIKSPALPGEDRSAVAASVMFKLMHKGVNDATIEAVFEANPIGERYDSRQQLIADIERLRGKFILKQQQEVVSEVGVSRMDFYAYMPEHKYIFTPTGEMWVAASVNARVPPIALVNHEGKTESISATNWLDQNRSVEQMTWAPGQPALIQDQLISNGGWFERKEVACFNLYRPSTLKLGDPDKARRWLDHVRKIYPDDADHIIKWLAARVQQPQNKINHAQVLGSNKQGIGKDTLIEPIKRAIGSWNFHEESPQGVMGSFTAFLKSVILRISEAHDLGEFNRFQFYDRMKSITASPPDVLGVNEKYIPKHYIPNCVGIIITTNHKDGLYLPAEDRRHYVAWSQAEPTDFEANYWSELWDWLNHGGDSHVAAYLMQLDISAFDIKAPPRKTTTFWEIVSTNQSPEDAELADVLDTLALPDAVTLETIRLGALERGDHELALWLTDRKNRRAIPHRLEKCGYVPVRNDGAEDGMWKIAGKRQAMYAKKTLPLGEQLAAGRKLGNPPPKQSGWR